jgi:hypothetical protein
MRRHAPVPQHCRPWCPSAFQCAAHLPSAAVQAIFSTMPPSIENVRAGKLRALAVTSPARSDALPDLPTIGDVLPGYEASMVTGLGAPKTPSRAKLSHEEPEAGKLHIRGQEHPPVPLPLRRHPFPPVARAGTPLQEAQERHHHRSEVAALEADPHRFAGRAALRHQ